MKILYIYDKFPSSYQEYLINLLDAIRKKAKIKTLVYNKKAKADYSINRYGFRDSFQTLMHKLKLSKFKSIDVRCFSKFDIIHLQHSYLWRKVEPFKKLKGNKPKIVITLRGGDTYVKPWLDKNWQDFYKYSSNIDAFVVMSQHQKKYLCEKWNVPFSKIHVIPISFGEKSTINPKYPNSGKLRLVSAFRMTWEKNIQGTIQLAKILKERKIDFEWDIYGDGKDLGQLYYLVDRYNLNDSVKPMGILDNDTLKGGLPNYDFFVQLSLSEAFPTTVLEAQAAGLPCIVSNSGGLPEAVLNDETAIVLDHNDYIGFVDGIINLKEDREKYFTFSKNAINYVNNNYTIDAEIKKLTSLYEKLYE
jgi:glycosyltransferase involved in cell wall biosynthesis